MAAGAHVRIDPDGDPLADALRLRHPGQEVELGLGFDIDLADAGPEGEGQLLPGLAGAREDDPSGRDPGRQGPADLAFGDGVRAGPEPREGRQHREVGIGLHRIVDLHRARGEGVPEHRVMTGQGRGGVDIGRRAHRLGDAPQGNLLTVQLAAADLEVVH